MTDKRKRHSGDYEVGYRKPPAEHRFAPGRSGNPKGRRKKVVETDKELLIRLLAEERKVPLDGKSVKMTRREALWRRLLAECQKSPKLLLEVLKILQLGGRAESSPAPDNDNLPTADAEIIERYLAAKVARPRSNKGGGDE
ncbi:DUF5681 domain-containing protein [Flaviflagellibacter deserti]|uniref:DUF5681 domain-containing protein n=1 Tax=Flaviflagellibacter deserti TaxID=2267266 RepID=A0ABV9YYJ0_9HYPH